MYIANDILEFFDAVDIIENDRIKQATIVLTNDVNHCHKLRFLSNLEITISSINKSNYNIYLDPRQVTDNPAWKFNTTPFWFQNQRRLCFSNLHFIYSFFKYDYYTLILDFDEETKTTTETIDYCDGQILTAFGIVLMEFDSSKVNFKHCKFENNTNRPFEIIAKKESLVTFENCNFNGDFNFIFDSNSRIIIQ